MQYHHQEYLHTKHVEYIPSLEIKKFEKDIHVILKNAVCDKRTIYLLPFNDIIFHGICLEIVMKLDKCFLKTHFIIFFNDNSCNIRSYIYQTVDSLFIQFTLLQQIILAIQDSNNKNKATSKVEYIFNYFIVKYL